MTDTPLRANPEDRPGSPSGGRSPPSGNAPAPPGGGAKDVAPAKTARPSTGQFIRPIGKLAQPQRDWRRAWSGFLVGVAALAVATGLAWLLWDMAEPPRTVEAPAEGPPGSDLAEVEALLDGLGFPPGKIDGVIDDDAVAAIRDFQATAGLPVDGAASAALLEELRAAQIELTGGQ